MVMIAPMLKPVANTRLWSMHSSALKRVSIAFTYATSRPFVSLQPPDSAWGATKIALPPACASMA